MIAPPQFYTLHSRTEHRQLNRHSAMGKVAAIADLFRFRCVGNKGEREKERE